MPFQPGISGNPRGRPKAGYSLRDLIRAKLKGKPVNEMLDKMLALAKDPHGDHLTRIRAAEFFAKHGWPEEASGQIEIHAPDATSVQVIHKHVRD